MTRLRTTTTHAAWAVWIVLGPSSVAQADERPDLPQRIDRLIRQLDDDSFQVRERAQRALLEVGQPAEAALRPATRHRSAEVRHRAKAILGQLLRRHLQGTWRSGNQVLIIRGGHWWWGTIDTLRPSEYAINRLSLVETGEEFVKADLWVGLGGRKGQTCKAIFRLDGDTLHYSGSYEARPTGFNNGSGYDMQWKRAKIDTN